MASILGTNPLDRLASYFKPCTRQFVQEDCNDIEDTLAELREQQKKNPLDVLDVFFRPLTKKFDYTDYYNDEICNLQNSFSDKIEIGKSIKISKIKSTKRRRVDSLEDMDKSLPSLSVTTTSSDTSSSESSDDEKGDSESFLSLEQPECDRDELQFDDNIIEDLETLCLVSDNSKTATASRKIAKPKSKKQPTVLYDLRDEKYRSSTVPVLPENDESEEKEDEVPRSLKKFREEKGAQKIQNKNGVPEAPGAGFTGRKAHKYLDMLDNQAFKARHQKIITKRFQEVNLSNGLSSLLSSGFKPASRLE